MNTLYLDCSMGAAGDMLTAALLELLPDRAGFLRRLNSLSLPGVAFRLSPASAAASAAPILPSRSTASQRTAAAMTIPTNTLMHTTIFMPTATGTPLWRISPV